MSGKSEYTSCEMPVKTAGKSGNRNRYYPFQSGYRWKGVKVQKYKDKGEDWSAIARQVLIGASGETAGFHLRYFEISPGGYSSFETHRHEHVVIGVRGEGRARINRRTVEVKHLDVLYINPDTPHRLYNPYEDTFGFFCIVNARRDRPKPVRKSRK